MPTANDDDEDEDDGVVSFQASVGNSLGMRTGVVFSCMDGTIGRCVGNSLEVIEALETLKGNGPDDLMELVTTLGNNALKSKEIFFCVYM